ncbi:MAG: hypothetical protein JRN52_09735 [Nitrososphaerota archaeon]|nr:hypothetical protein [Nitrososphaerota archaeon]
MIRDITKDQNESGVRPNYSVAKWSLALGLVFLITNNLFYDANSVEFFHIGAPSYFVFTSLFLILFGSAAFGFSAFSYLRTAKTLSTEIDSDTKQVKWPLGRIVSEAFFRERKLLLVSATLYAVLFAFLDGVLVFQPGVNFQNSYGASTASFLVTMCCGPTGYVPVLLMFFPSLNLGLQLIPFSGLIMLLISALVGLNVALLSTAVKKSRIQLSTVRSDKGLLGSSAGAVFGLFAGCPTCAAVFLFTMIAGSGATAASLFLSQLQPLFVLLSVPLLLASVVWQAKSIRRLLVGCAV